MNTGGVFNVITIAISILSLAVSGALALRQTRAAKDGYALPVVLDVFSKFRTDGYFNSEQYVLGKLRREFPTSVPYSDLPLSARVHLWNVAGLYDDLANLVAHGIISEGLVVGARGNTVRRVWEVIEPYVEQDRRLNGSSAFIYLEDLASRSARKSPAEVHTKLKLLPYGKAQRLPPVEKDASHNGKT